jgi:hypothetical protein
MRAVLLFIRPSFTLQHTVSIHRNGTEIMISDPRPNSELILATGRVYTQNPADHLMWKANLIQVI